MELEVATVDQCGASQGSTLFNSMRLTCVGLSAGNECQHQREIVELHNLVTRVVRDDALILSQSQLAGLRVSEYGI